MTNPSPAQAVADAARAVEDLIGDEREYASERLRFALGRWENARRTAREAGFVEVLVSREAVATLREYAAYKADSIAKRLDGSSWSEPLALFLVLQDLAAVLKEGK